MFKVIQYPVLVVQPYIEVAGMTATDVIAVDRNGIGVQHVTYFSGSQSVSVDSYEWYAVIQSTVNANNTIITLSNSIVGGDRIIVYRIGNNPIPGTIYSVYYQNIIAKYVVQQGDITEMVRDGLIAAINGESWGTTVTVLDIGTDRLEVYITGTTVNFTTQVGVQKYKKGYYLTLSGINYILYEAEANNAYPVLPSLGVSYAYDLLTRIPGTVEDYLYQPLAIYEYSDVLAGTTTVTGLPQVSGVPANKCVVDQNQQRVWFDADLNFGELIKIFEK